MSSTIKVKFEAITGDEPEHREKSINYLHKIGLIVNKAKIIDDNLEHEVYNIELRKKPQILKDLENYGYFEFSHEEYLIGKIDEKGLTLSIISPAGTALIFIPIKNIICIHSLRNDYIEDLISEVGRKRERNRP